VVTVAETPEDCWLTYQFLLKVAGPSLLAELNQNKAVAEILRVANEGTALMAYQDDKLVGVLGLMMVQWWYSDDSFITNRWFFAHPDLKFKGVGARLLAEAQAIGRAAGMPVIIIGHKRMRNNGVHFARVRTFDPNDPDPQGGSLH
jgi:GNAT superfamily N-acetyltransferase